MEAPSPARIEGSATLTMLPSRVAMKTPTATAEKPTQGEGVPDSLMRWGAGEPAGSPEAAGRPAPAPRPRAQPGASAAAPGGGREAPRSRPGPPTTRRGASPARPGGA